jgi:hypothetical protein
MFIFRVPLTVTGFTEGNKVKSVVSTAFSLWNNVVGMYWTIGSTTIHTTIIATLFSLFTDGSPIITIRGATKWFSTIKFWNFYFTHNIT